VFIILVCTCLQVYYTGSGLTQVVWSTVRLSMRPSQHWLEGFVAQVRTHRPPVDGTWKMNRNAHPARFSWDFCT